MKGFLSIDIDVSELQVNQCSSPRLKETNQNLPLTANKYYDEIFSQIEIFHDSNKCHPFSMLVSNRRGHFGVREEAGAGVNIGQTRNFIQFNGARNISTTFWTSLLLCTKKSSLSLNCLWQAEN